MLTRPKQLFVAVGLFELWFVFLFFLVATGFLPLLTVSCWRACLSLSNSYDSYDSYFLTDEDLNLPLGNYRKCRFFQPCVLVNKRARKM